MKPLPLILALLALAWGAPARADLSMVGRSTVVAMGMQGTGQEGLWLKKTRIRRDLVDRGKAYSHLYDLGTREITVINHSLRQAEVYPMNSLKPDPNTRVAAKDVKLRFNPTGQRRQLQAWSCEEYALNLSMPVEVGGERVDFELDGQVWLARFTREQGETAAFVHAAQTPDFFMGVPAMAKASPSQAQGISEAFRRIAPLGLLCSLDVHLKYEGNGRLAELSRKMASRISVAYERYGGDPLKDEVFDIPAGYLVVRK